MALDDVLAKMKDGGVLFIEQEMGAEDSLAYAEKALSGYKIYRAAPDKSAASVFEKAMPQHSELFRIKTPPKVLAAYYISQNGTMITSVDRPGMALDADIVSGMLSAVGNFVADTFSQSGQDTDKSKPKGNYGVISFEDNTIQLFRGGGGVIALMYPGAPVEEVRKDLEDLNRRIDEKHLAELESWNGDAKTPYIADIQTSMKNFFFDSKRYEGELDLEKLNTARMAVKENVLRAIESEARAGKIAFVFDGVQNIDNFSAEMLEYIARNTNVPVILQYETGVLDEGIKNPALNSVIETLKKENKYQQHSIKSSMNIEALVISKLASIDEQAFELLRYAAVADEFDASMLSSLLAMPKTSIEEIGKKLSEVGLLKGDRLANSRLKQRAIESIPEHRKGAIETSVAYALAKKGDIYAPKIAELLLPYAEISEEDREKAVQFSIKAAEQFTAAANLEGALSYYQKAADIDKNIPRKIQTSKQVLNLEWITTRLDDMITHADALEKIAEEAGDMHAKGFAVWSRAKAYGTNIKKEFDRAMKDLGIAEQIFSDLGDKDMLAAVLNAKGIVYGFNKEAEKAIECYNKTIELCGDNLTLKARCLQNIGDTYIFKKDLKKAEEFTKQALELHELIGDQISIGRCSINLGDIYYGMGELDKAIELGYKGLEISNSNGLIKSALHAYNIIGAALLDKNKHEESRLMLQKGIELAKRTGNYYYLPLAYLNLFELHHKEEQKSLAESLRLIELGEGAPFDYLGFFVRILDQDRTELEKIKEKRKKKKF